MLKTSFKLLSGAMLLCLWAGVAQAATPKATPSVAPNVAMDAFAGMKGVLNIAGGTAHIPVMKDAARQIMTKYPDIKITIAGGGSGVGVEQVGAGLVNIGNTGRPLKDAEKEKFGLVSFPFAIDGVAAVVHPSNPVKGVSTAQLADIYAGRITNWKDVGGQDAPINVYTREDGSGTRECFVDNGLKKGSILPAANVLSSNGAMKTSVAQDKHGLGYVSIGHLDTNIRALALDGSQATQESASAMTYPVVRKLYMNTKGTPQGLTKSFIEYIYSLEGAEFIKKSGYIPLKP